MEDNQTLTTRKRNRYDWWKKHSSKKAKVSRTSERSVKGKHSKKPAKNQVEEEKVKADKQEENKKRYILFVGNLPFDVKVEDVKRHFKCTGDIKEFRLMTKKTGESKGCGFLEFNNEEGYLKALNLHHSIVAGRKINVEMTCGGGGGGKGTERLKKLREKQKKFRRKRKRKSKTKEDIAHDKSKTKE